MKKIKLKKKINPISIIIIILIFILIFGIILLNYFSRKVSPIIFKYAEIETKKFSNIIINDAVAKNITNKVSSDEIFDVTNDKNDEIKSIDFNTANINKYLTDATRSIQKNLKNIENGDIKAVEYSANLTKKYSKNNLKKGIIYYVNSGLIFNNPLLSNLGPKIPVKISLKGDVISYISAEVSDYGINNSVVKVFANLKITEDIILPFYGKSVDMEAKVPIAVKLVTGKIPEYYSKNSKQSAPIVIPN